MDRPQRLAVAAAAACCLLLALSALTPADAAAVHKRAVANTRAGSELSTEAPPKICLSSTPCGWAVYVPFTRRVDYFMKNTCDCPRGKMCTRTDDDLSVSAYVYRCKAPILVNTTEVGQA